MLRLIIYHLKVQYFRFLKAHYSFHYMKKSVQNQISKLMIDRFETTCEDILYNRQGKVQIDLDYQFHLDFLLSYFLVLYRQQYNENQIMVKFETEIFNRFIQTWNAYKELLKVQKPQILESITEYTAVILLKMKIRIIIFMKIHNLAEVASRPKFHLEHIRGTTIKLYYELRDKLMLVPMKCQSFPILKTCFLYEGSETLKQVASKYNLKSSLHGSKIFAFLHFFNTLLYSKITQNVWDNYTLLRNYFYQNLFAILQNFKQYFMIQDMSEVEQLEEQIGDIINQFRSDSKNFLNLTLADKLDITLYEGILDLKALFGQQNYLKRDPSIINDLINGLLKILQGFNKKNSTKMNSELRQLIMDIAECGRKWRMKLLEPVETVYQIQIQPLNKNLDYPQVFHDVKSFPDKQQEKAIDFSEKSEDVNNEKKQQQLWHDIKHKLNQAEENVLMEKKDGESNF